MSSADGILDDDDVRSLIERGAVPMPRSAPPPAPKPPTLNELVDAIERRCRTRGYTCSCVWVQRRAREMFEGEVPRWALQAVKQQRAARATTGTGRL